jgi:hypothetical protein
MSMIRRLPSILVAAAIVAGTCAPAVANIREITVYNDTPTCAIVTAFETGGQKVHARIPGDNPRQLRPHAEFDLPTSSSAHVDVTAVVLHVDVMANADCTGASIYTVTQHRNAAHAAAEYLDAALFKTKGGYMLRILAK